MATRPLPSGYERITDDSTKNVLRVMWDSLQDVGSRSTPTPGTLSPDQRPSNLGLQDTGRLFYATDFDRIYRWTGSGWLDAFGSPTRNSIAFFPVNQDPGVGWARCGGLSVLKSTPDGRVLRVITPSVPPYEGLTAWVRL